MRNMARIAIEAATRAGAHYADVRIGDQRTFVNGSLGTTWRLGFTHGYGLRVQVGGGVAFVGGTDPTADRLVAAAHSAVATARGIARIAAPLLRVPAPVVTGEWMTSVEVDPFEVSPDDHAFVANGFGALKGYYGRVVAPAESCKWTSETRVFASSDGSLVTQQLRRAVPELWLDATPATFGDRARLIHQLSLVPPCNAGFEILLGTDLHARIIEAMHDMESWRTYAGGSIEVGRKEVVLDGQAFGALIGKTVVPALMLNNLLGDEQDVTGTSFFASPDAALGQQLGVPQLALSVVTGGTHFGRMQWDDEGIVPRTFPLIDRGAIVDCVASRTDVQALSSWYTQRGQPVVPAGAFSTEDVSLVPRPSPGALVVESVPAGPSLTELVKAMKDGLLVRGAWDVQVDQQGAGGSLIPQVAFEVRDGRITQRIDDFRVDFSTKKLLKELTVIGGPMTSETMPNPHWGGLPLQNMMQTMTAPAVHIREANVASNKMVVS